MQKNLHFCFAGGQPGGAKANFIYHPLIHTPLRFTQVQDVEKKKAELKIPHSKSLNLDIVSGPK